MTAGIRLSVTRSMDVMASQSPLELLHLRVACTLLKAAIMLITINQILSAILNLLFFFFFFFFHTHMENVGRATARRSEIDRANDIFPPQEVYCTLLLALDATKRFSKSQRPCTKIEKGGGIRCVV